MFKDGEWHFFIIEHINKGFLIFKDLYKQKKLIQLELLNKY